MIGGEVARAKNAGSPSVSAVLRAISKPHLPSLMAGALAAIRRRTAVGRETVVAVLKRFRDALRLAIKIHILVTALQSVTAPLPADEPEATNKPWVDL